MTQDEIRKEARANIRKALSILKNRIRFPKVSLRDVLESEDMKAIFKEFVSAKLQKMVSNQ